MRSTLRLSVCPRNGKAFLARKAEETAARETPLHSLPRGMKETVVAFQDGYRSIRQDNFT